MKLFLRARGGRFAFMALIAASGAACTLINALDDLKPAVVVGPDATTTTDAGGGATDATVADTSVGPTPSGPPKGAIVVGGALAVVSGVDAGTGHVLTALDPTTGAELPKARKKMTVAAIAYDGDRDVWYIFESGTDSYFPGRKDLVTLHVAELDTYTGEWTDLTTLPVPPIIAFTHLGVITKRLVYIAYRGTDLDTEQDIVTVDTTTPNKTTVVEKTPIVGGNPFGLIATRGTTGSQAGFVNLLRRSSCDGGGGCLDIVPVQYPDGHPTFKPGRTLGTYSGAAAYGSWRGGGVDVLAWRSSANDPSTPIRTFTPATQAEQGSPIAFTSSDLFLKPMAFAECQRQVLIIGTNNDLSVTAKPLAKQTTNVAQVVLQHSGQAVVFEPYTSTVLAPFSQGNGYELTAMTLSGSEEDPRLAVRPPSSWKPPVELRPEIVAARTPTDFACPTGN